MLVILILLVAGCDNGMKDGGNKYEREEEVSIRLVVETDIGKAECFISGGKDLDKYNSAVIIVNGIPLKIRLMADLKSKMLLCDFQQVKKLK